jgi:hypothetical protein
LFFAALTDRQKPVRFLSKKDDPTRMIQKIDLILRSTAGRVLAIAAFTAALIAIGSLPRHVEAKDAATALPRTADGKPDFSGFWQVLTSANWNIQDHTAEKGIPAGQGIVEGNVIPYQPWALAKRDENYAKRATADPQVKSYIQGVPRITYTPFPFQIIETPQEFLVLYEYVHQVRHLFRDGSDHPPGHIDWWMGDSRAKWDGDTLVVDVTDFNDQTWFDHAGNFHSDQLHVVERYTLTDPDHIDYEATIEDPKVFTKSWKIDLVLYRHKEKGFKLLDYEGYGFGYEKYYP